MSTARFERQAGFLSKVRTAVIEAVKDANPSHRESRAGNEVYTFTLRSTIEGDEWMGTLHFTRKGSRFDGMSEDEVERNKANEQLQRALKAAAKAGVDIEDATS